MSLLSRFTHTKTIVYDSLWLAAKTLSVVLALQYASAATRTTGVGFQGVQTTVAIGLGIPHGAAIDSAGNIYVTDLIDSQVLMIPRGAANANCTVTGSCVPIGSGFVQPTGVAVDASGNVFVTDAATESLYRITAAGVQTIVASGLASPSGVALATDGTAYVAVSGAIARVAPTGAVTTFATGPSEPGGIALSSTGNLYLSDLGGNRVLAFAANAAETTLVTGLNAPQAVALDGAGNLYVADTGNNRILSLPATGTGYVCPVDCTVLALTTSAPSGIVSCVSGTVYVADTGHGQVVKLAQDADFHTAPVVASNASPSASLTLNYFLYGSSCASPPVVSVLTKGATGKDFTYDPAADVCTPGTPDTLAITVNFAPLSPGLRTGSVQFTDATGVPQVGTYLHGIGKGPQITWTPGVVANVMTSSATQ